MGHFTGIDSLAYESRALHWPPSGKLLLSICLLIGSLSSNNPYGPMAVLRAGFFLFLFSLRGKVPKFIVLLILAVMVFNVAGVAIIAITQAGTVIAGISIAGLGINVTKEGADLAALVFLRTFAGLSVMLFFASSTPMPHIFRSLKGMGLPADIAEITVLIYRYSFMIFEQAERMMCAAGCRLGFRGWRNSMSTLGILAANVFIRSMEFAERSQQALQSRNYDGSFPAFREPQKLTAGWAFVSIAALASVYLIGNVL